MNSNVIAIVSATVAVFSGGGFVFTRIRKAFKTVEQLDRLIKMVEPLDRLIEMVEPLKKLVPIVDSIETVITKELEHNHGSSMKDDLHGMAVSFGLTQRQVDDLGDVVTEIQTVLNNHILKGED